MFSINKKTEVNKKYDEIKYTFLVPSFVDVVVDNDTFVHFEPIFDRT